MFPGSLNQLPTFAHRRYLESVAHRRCISHVRLIRALEEKLKSHEADVDHHSCFRSNKNKKVMKLRQVGRVMQLQVRSLRVT